MQSGRSGVFRRLVIGSLCAVIAVVALSAIGIDIMRRARSMQTATTSVSDVIASPVGAHVKAVLRIGREVGPGAFTSEILEQVQGVDYRGTGRSVELKLASDTRFIMGASTDIRTGAIVQANGSIDAAHALIAAKIVVLNDYVHVVR